IETTEEGTKILATVDGNLKTISESSIRHYTRRARIAQSSTLLPVADEPASPIGDVTQEMVSKFVAQELEINSLKARIKLLEDKDRGVTEQSEDDAPIKRRMLDERAEVDERVSDDTEEMASVLTFMDAASILTSRGVQVVPTAAEVATATISIPTGSGVVTTASSTIPTIDVQIARELEEEMARDAQRMNEQIARDAEIARIHAEEELQIMIDGLDKTNETVAKYLQEYHQFAIELPIERRIELISNLEEAERFKRKGLRLEQESVKKLKTSEEGKATEEVPEEKVKEMMQLVPVEEIYVEALKVKQPIIDYEHLDREDLTQLWALVKETLNIRAATIEWKLYDTCGVHHVTSKDKEISMPVKKDYPLRKGLSIVMISYKLQVENYSQMVNDLILKIYKTASSPRQQDD
nr:hypothetical protein [Tanacetum cinerariifolium]